MGDLWHLEVKSDELRGVGSSRYDAHVDGDGTSTAASEYAYFQSCCDWCFSSPAASWYGSATDDGDAHDASCWCSTTTTIYVKTLVVVRIVECVVHFKIYIIGFCPVSANF